MKSHILKAYINKKNKQIILTVKKKEVSKSIINDIKKRKGVRLRFMKW